MPRQPAGIWTPRSGTWGATTWRSRWRSAGLAWRIKAVGTAEAHFRRAVSRAPHAIGAWTGLANALEQQNDRASALDAWRHATAALVAFSPASADPWMLGLPLAAGGGAVLTLARRLRAAGETSAGDHLVNRLRALFPGDEAIAAEASTPEGEASPDAGSRLPVDPLTHAPDSLHGILFREDAEGPRLLMDQAAEADRAGHADMARTLYRRAGSLAVASPSPLDPRLADLALGAAEALRRMGDAETASGLLDRLASHRPDDPEVLRQRALALFGAGRTAQALDMMEQARRRLGPESGTLALTLVHVALLRRAERLDDAIVIAREAVARWPHDAESHSILARTLSQAGRPSGALAAAFAALLRNPDLGWCHSLIARILESRNQLDPALEHLAQVVDLDPDAPDGHVALALTLLKRGDWSLGWDHYEWRVLKTDRPAESFAQPSWQGETLDNRRLLVWHERQGLVEELMFLRLAPAAARVAGGSLTIEADRRLVPLLRRGLPGHTVVADSDPPAAEARAADLGAQCPFGSLPRLVAPDPAAGVTPAPTIAADEALAGRLRAQWLRGAPGALLVGVCWSPQDARRRADRVAPLEAWAPVLSREGLRFVSLQVGPAAAEAKGTAILTPAETEAGGLDDLDGLAARVAAVDLVVTVDAMPAHLAGSLAVPGLVLLPFAPDWRWGRTGQRTPWYPSLRLARQTLPGDWSGPMARVARALDRYRDEAIAAKGAA